MAAGCHISVPVRSHLTVIVDAIGAQNGACPNIVYLPSFRSGRLSAGFHIFPSRLVMGAYRHVLTEEAQGTLRQLFHSGRGKPQMPGGDIRPS